MPEKEVMKDPSNWSAFTWLMVFAACLVGGVSNYHRRLKSGHPVAGTLAEFAGESATCIAAGFSGYMVTLEFSDSIGLAVSVCCLCSHYAPRLLFRGDAIIDAAAKKIQKGIEK